MSRYSTIELVPGGDWPARATIQDKDGQNIDVSTWTTLEAKIQWATAGGGTIDPLTVDYSDAANGNLGLFAPRNQTGSVPYGSMSELILKLNSSANIDQTFYAHINGVPSMTNCAEAIFTVPGTPGPPGIGDKYTVPIWVQGRPNAGQRVARFVVERTVQFPAGLTESQGNAEDAATAESIYSFRRESNGSGEVEFGTVTFAAGSALGTFSAAAATQFDAGDVLKVYAPPSQDATLADVSISLAGDRITPTA